MTPSAWKKAWAPDPLVFRKTKTQQLPEAAHRFLETHGLPQVLIIECETPFELQFKEVTKKLALYTDQFGPGAFTDAEAEEWGNRYIIGVETFCNGGAYFCVHHDTGTVTRIDPETRDPEMTVNTSLEQFASALLILRTWSAKHNGSSGASRKKAIAALSAELKRNDKKDGFVSSLLRSILRAEPNEYTVSANPKLSKSRS